MSNQPKNINPHYERKALKSYTLEECITGLTEDRKILSYLISKSESSRTQDIEFVQNILSKVSASPKTRRVAISGSPGVGKSTFINSYASILARAGFSVAVLPVDPSSQISKGSILGDKTRMEDLISLEQVYVKPMASALVLGGVAPGTLVARMLCERAGFDYVLIETVGVGQSEVEVRHLVDCFLLLLQPAGGDALQGIKRGIMEIADILIVTKADGELLPQAKLSLKEYKNIISLLQSNNYGWKAKAKLYSSVTQHEGMEVPEMVDAYFDYMSQEGKLSDLRLAQERRYVLEKANDLILERAKSGENISTAYKALEENIKTATNNPIAALLEFKKAIN